MCTQENGVPCPLNANPNSARERGGRQAQRAVPARLTAAQVDGITCSSRLDKLLSLGSLVFKEDSGYRWADGTYHICVGAVAPR